MEKKLLIAILLMLITAATNAQNLGKQDLQFSYGPFARENFLHSTAETVLFPLLSNSADVEFFKSFALTYRYQAKDKLAIGFAVGTSRGDYTADYLFANPERYSHSGVFLAFETKFTYVQKPMVSLYGIAGVGGFKSKETPTSRAQRQPETVGFLTAQLTPLGIQFGNELAAFAEFGYGYKGVLNMGFCLKF